MARMTKMARGIHCCPKFFFYLVCATSVSILQIICVCVFVCVDIYIYIYIYIYTYLTAYSLYMNYGCYQITLQLNIFTQIGEVRSVDLIFIVGAPAWRLPGEYVTLDGTFYSILF
jgi:hypothetical protein